MLEKVNKKAKCWSNKHGSALLIAIGIGSMITSTVLAVKATPKAIETRDDILESGGTKKDAYLKSAKHYACAAVVGAGGIFCVVEGHRVQAKKTVAIATAYKTVETAYSQYKSKTIEEVGEETEKKIREKVNREKAKEDISSNVVPTENACYDYTSGRYFQATKEDIRSAVNSLNEIVLREGYASLNDFYDLLGLSRTNVGDILGWSSMVDVEVYYEGPYLMISYEVTYGFDEMY